MRIGLVGCVKQKAAEARPAGELYVSALFVGRRRFVERSCDRWVILSARHGVVEPSTVLEPYDETLDTASTGKRRRWSRRVLDQLTVLFGPLAEHTFEIHAGSNYRDFGLIEGLRAAGAHVEVPAGTLPLGKLLSFYAGSSPPSNAVVPRGGPPRARTRGGYDGLREYLERSSSRSVTLTFGEIERIVDRQLPPSARRHRAWWANHDSHPMARQWLAVGWRVDLLNPVDERVRFVR